MRSSDEVIIKVDSTIVEAMQILDTSALQIVLVVNEKGKLVGTVTDGDVRRAILRGVDLQKTFICKIMNANPHTAMIGDSRDKMLATMRSYKILQIPIVDSEGRVVQLATMDYLLSTPAYSNQVVIMAGGLGSRLGELTKNCPKPLLSVGGKPVLETIVENFKTYGFSNFIFSVNYKAEMIEKYFADGSAYGVKISYIREEKRLGTAGSLGLLRETPVEPFIVINGDVLTRVNFEHLLQFHLVQNSVATMGVREYSIQVPYGVVETQGADLKRIKEKPVHRHFVSTGIYVLNPEVLQCVKKNEYLDMPVLFERLLQKNKKATVFPVNEYWMDIGQKEDLEAANSSYKEIFLS